MARLSSAASRASSGVCAASPMPSAAVTVNATAMALEMLMREPSWCNGCAPSLGPALCWEYSLLLCVIVTTTNQLGRYATKRMQRRLMRMTPWSGGGIAVFTLGGGIGRQGGGGGTGH